MADIRPTHMRVERQWEQAVNYLVSHAGRWVPGWEIGDAVYGGHCSPGAVKMLIRRARVHFAIESDYHLGYRMGRAEIVGARCPHCQSLRVRYPAEWVCYGCTGTGAVDLEVGRAAYDPATRQGTAWTPAELAFIRDNRNTMSNAQLAAALNRTESGVRGQSTAMGLARKKYIK